MMVTMTMQEILATIERNQQQIDLLTANNTQLVHFLLSQGMIQSLSELPGLSGHTTRGMAVVQAPGAVLPLLAAPTKLPGRSGRKRIAKPSGAADTQRPTSNVGRGKLQSDLLVAWARRAGGTLKLAEFRAAQEGKVPGIKESFYSTTMYTKVGKLTQQGIFTKIGPGEYRLNDGVM